MNECVCDLCLNTIKEFACKTENNHKTSGLTAGNLANLS